MITVKNLSLHIGGFSLRNIEFKINKGEFFVILGPTGAGKTLLLEAIAGLVPVTNGRIIFEDKDITFLPPEKRNIALVYQDYALFPHFSVKDNILYGTRFHHNPQKNYHRQFSWIINSLRLTSILHRFPDKLSGGEKQRVSLARALIVDPKVLLLDEPLNALDVEFKTEVRKELRLLHRSLKKTFLMVTHNFEDVLYLADRVGIINKGEIVQIGTPDEIFQQPKNPFIAKFLETKNLFLAEFTGTKAKIGNLIIEIGKQMAERKGYIIIRPESIVLSKKIFPSSMRNCIFGSVVDISHIKPFIYEVKVKAEDTIFSSVITKASLDKLQIKHHQNVFVCFKATSIHAFI